MAGQDVAERRHHGLDDPQPLPETHGYATSGWNAAPTAGKVIARIAPLLGLVLERLIFRHLRTASAIAKLVVTIGLSVARSVISRRPQSHGARP